MLHSLINIHSIIIKEMFIGVRLMQVGQTGHSYSVYGPLANGAKTLLFEGVPNYPDFSRFWQVCDKHQVNIFYTAPTAIRALMKEGDDFVKNVTYHLLEFRNGR